MLVEPDGIEPTTSSMPLNGGQLTHPNKRQHPKSRTAFHSKTLTRVLRRVSVISSRSITASSAYPEFTPGKEDPHRCCCQEFAAGFEAH
jgi:hypothetical protein